MALIFILFNILHNICVPPRCPTLKLYSDHINTTWISGEAVPYAIVHIYEYLYIVSTLWYCIFEFNYPCKADYYPHQPMERTFMQRAYMYIVHMCDINFFP